LGGWSPPLQSKELSTQIENVASTPPANDPHAEHRRSGSVWHDDPNRIALDRVVAIATERGVVDTYAIAFPKGSTGVYSILSDRNRAFSRTYIHLDQYSGKVLADVRFKNFGFFGKLYTFGIIAHEGQLFGLANQILGLVTALGIITIAVTGLAMAWSRRPKVKLLDSSSPGLFQNSRAAVVIAVGLAVFLPMMAATLLLLLVADFAFARCAAFLRPAAD
jgi:uncharacterized iron-regulated membrane protein